MQVQDRQLISDQTDEDNLVEFLAEAMSAKLAENRGKVHWLSNLVTLPELFGLLADEVQELNRLMVSGDEVDPGDAWGEAADVANFAAMIADRLSQAPEGV